MKRQKCSKEEWNKNTDGNYTNQTLTTREATIHKCKYDEIPVKIQMRKIILYVILSKSLGKISPMKIWTA